MIRKYEEKDIPEIEILGKLLHHNYKFNLNIYSSCYVAELDNDIIGFITFSVIYDRAEILDIIVDQKHRNKHYGKELLNKVIEDIKDKCENITLEVNKDNKTALNFYKKSGFEIASTRKGYYANEDAYLMIKKLEVK